MPLVALLAVAAGGLQGWRWFEQGEWPLLVGSGAAVLVGLPLGGAIAIRAVLHIPDN